MKKHINCEVYASIEERLHELRLLQKKKQQRMNAIILGLDVLYYGTIATVLYFWLTSWGK